MGMGEGAGKGPMKEQIAKLLQLQSIDRRLHELERDLAVLPEQLREARETLTARMGEWEAAKKEIERATLTRKASEGELDKNTEQIRKYNQQLFEVKTNKEYSALQVEIEGLRKINSDLETRVLVEMERIEALESKRKEAARAVEAAEEEVKKTEARVQAESSEIGALAETVRAEREQAKVSIDKAILGRYEKIRTGKGSVALARIDREACEVCYRSIPPQQIIEVKRLDRVVVCEGCGRILVWED